MAMHPGVSQPLTSLPSICDAHPIGLAQLVFNVFDTPNKLSPSQTPKHYTYKDFKYQVFLKNYVKYYFPLYNSYLFSSF